MMEKYLDKLNKICPLCNSYLYKDPDRYFCNKEVIIGNKIYNHYCTVYRYCYFYIEPKTCIRYSFDADSSIVFNKIKYWDEIINGSYIIPIDELYNGNLQERFLKKIEMILLFK